LHLPVVLEVGRRRVPSVVVGDQGVAQRGLVVDAEQELRELVPAVAGGRVPVAVGQRAVAVELVATAGGAEHGDRLQALLEQVEAEPPGLVAAVPGRVVRYVLGLLAVLVLLGLAQASSSHPGAALPY